MNPPESVSVPKKLNIPGLVPAADTTINPTNNDIDSFASAYSSGSARAETPKNNICPKNLAEKKVNELRSMETIDDASMETNEVNSPDQAQTPPTSTPRKIIDLRKRVIDNSPTVYAVETSNRFEELQGAMTDNQTASTSSAVKDKVVESTQQQSAKPVRQTTPPPIVIVGKDEYNIMEDLDQITSKEYWIKYTANSIIVHTNNIPDYDAIRRACDEVGMRYHTYSATGRKTHAFVLRGMAQRHTVEEITDFLRLHTSINAQKVFKMRTTGAPLFMVVTDATWTINKLNKDYSRILRVGVQWENRRSANPITQCKRCQLWGHSMGNCKRNFRCSKCAEAHEITQCCHTGKPTCANCRGEHRAFSRDCPVYQQKLTQYYEKFPPAAASKPTYIPAPPPTNVAWTNKSLYTTGPSNAQPPPARAPPTTQAPPPAQASQLYNQNFPGPPGSTRNTRTQSVPQQPAPAAAPAGGSVSSQLNALRGKWDEVNALINLDNMIHALDMYISMLRAATSNEDLFNVSRDFFCNILPSINLRP